MKFTREILGRKRGQKGIAIVMAVFMVVLISYIVVEVTYETTIEYSIHSQAVSRLKAYYAAKSGVEMSLLRIKIYKTIQAQFGSQLGNNAGMLNLIWSFPIPWPPILPAEATGVDKEMMNEKVKESKMDANFTATIIDEGSKIDLNDLDSPSKTIRESTKQQLLRVFESLIEQDRNWMSKHQNFRAEELVNNIIDWEDTDKTALNGGDERAMYPHPPPDIEPWPPNRSFRTLDELRMVAGMTDEYFDILAPRVTIFGAKAINPNSASRDVLQSLDPSMTELVVTEVLKRRDSPQNGGFYTSAQDFWNFVNSKGGRVAQATMDQTPLIFTAVTNFKIQSVGEYKGAIREIDAVVFDLDAAAAVVGKAVQKDGGATGSNQANQQPPGTPANAAPTPTPAQGKTNQTPTKGPPRIVYWNEK